MDRAKIYQWVIDNSQWFNSVEEVEDFVYAAIRTENKGSIQDCKQVITGIMRNIKP